MIDYTRAKLFCMTNNLNHKQIDELLSILKDIQHQTIDECDRNFTKIFDKHHEKTMKIIKSDH